MLTSFGITSAPLLDDGVAETAEDATLEPSLRALVVASPAGELAGKWARAIRLPVLRVPVPDGDRQGLALLQDGAGELPHGMEDGEFATVAIGPAGAKNAALFVVAALSVSDAQLRARWEAFRAAQTAAVLEGPALRLAD